MRRVSVLPRLDIMRDPYHNYALREARARLGYTVDYLAELTRINLQTLHAYERLRCMPNPAAAQRIANALERDVNELFPRCLAKLVREINRERREERAEESMRIPWSSVPRRRLLVEDVVAEDEGDDENILRERMESILETLGNRERIVLAYTFGLSEYGQ